MRDDYGLRLADLLRHDAAIHRHRVAVRLDGAEITYGELAARVDAVAQALRSHVAPGDRVGLWLQNSIAWIASFIAIDALGAVSVPINTRLTAHECRSVLDDALARVVVTTSSYRRRAYLDELLAVERPEAGIVAICASDAMAPAQWPVHARGRAGARSGGLCANGGRVDDLLCIQYTSGTTSRPKGVMLTNRGYIETAAYVARCQQLTPSSQFVSAAPFFHCSGTMHAITVCLLVGCTLNAFPAWDPERFLHDTQRYRCDVAHMVYFRDVLSLGADRARPMLASLRVAHDLGTRAYLMRLHDELGLAGISNLYGMTETAGQYTMWHPDDPLEKRVSANGRTQPGNRLRIGDPETGAALAPGSVGEIQMKGRTLTPGYFGASGPDRGAFTEDGWLRSGDLGTIGDEGELRYIARFKEIIRVGGENLAPAEVEQAIRDVSGLQQVCVLGMPDERLDEVPVAVFVGRSAVGWVQVLDRLRLELAGFKIPTRVYEAREFPLTATNRVQRAMLREWISKGVVARVA